MYTESNQGTLINIFKVLIASYFAIFATLKQQCEEGTTNLLEAKSLNQQSANSWPIARQLSDMWVNISAYQATSHPT